MSKEMLDRLLAGTLPDPDGNGMLSVPLKSVVIGHNLAAAAADLVRPLGLGLQLAVVMDPATRAVLGEAVLAGLSSDGVTAEAMVLGDLPHPDMAAVRHVMAATEAADGLIAVGSGSINDITKFAAHRAGKPYVVFGTAPSMNGYTSVSAAITEDGLKKSLSATLPRGVFLDLDVMAAAPHRLIAAGFGDSLARATAQTDWLMAHLLLAKPYREAPFRLLADDEDALIANAAGLRDGNLQAVTVLVRTLVLSGLGMTICGGSYPASQGEHLIAHYIDMRGEDLPMTHHGEQIAVTTLTMARLQERILAKPALALEPTTDTAATMIARFGPELGRSCWEAFRPKRLDAEMTDAVNRRLAASWPSISRQLRAVGRPARELSAALKAAGSPTSPGDLGIANGFYRKAAEEARLIRDRFTMLDVAAACGEAIL